jgi:hypothetical protein
MMIDPLLCGAIIDPAVTDAVCQALADAGKQPFFGDAQPGLAGFGIGKSFLHQDSETKLFGQPLPSWMQRRGTCTDQGTGRAFHHATLSAIADGILIGSHVEYAIETMYGYARVQLGKGQFGRAKPWGYTGNDSGDGCSGAFVAQAAHDCGAPVRGVYGSFDLTKPREDLAVAWSNTGCPTSLIPEANKYRASACMLVKTVENLRDGLAAKYGATLCGHWATEGQRDANGEVAPTDISPGGHCEEVSGVFIDIAGDLLFIIQNSWGTQGPSGGGPIKMQDGREVVLAQGAAAVHVEWIQKYLKQGEIWLIGRPENLPQTASTATEQAV